MPLEKCMQIAFMSDIHANFEALSSLEDDLLQTDLVVSLGDHVGYFCQVNEVIEFVRTLNGLCILGNHDYFLLHKCPSDALPAVRFGIEYAKSVITPDNYEWLSGLPLVWGGIVEGISLFLCHGSPWNPLHDYLYANNPSFEMLDTYQYDIIAYGQTHRSFSRWDRKPYLLNPGSIGQSRDMMGYACAAILDTDTMQIRKIECPYNVEPVLARAFNNGAGEWITKHMREAQAKGA